MKLTLKFDQANGSWQARADGILYCLSRKASMGSHDPSVEGEYMIVARLGKHPKGYIVDPVDPELHVLVDHDGFMCSGSMCRTDTTVRRVHGAGRQAIALVGRTITPGRVHTIVRTTDNVNPDWSFPIWDQTELEALKARPDFKPENLRLHNEEDRKPGSAIAYYKHGWRTPKPGQCYITMGETRACGLPSVEEVG